MPTLVFTYNFIPSTTHKSKKMNNQVVSYESQTVYPLKGFLFYLTFTIVGTTLIIAISRHEHNTAIGAIGWIVIMLCPLLFKKNLQLYLCNKALIVFDKSQIHIAEYSLIKENLINEFTISWNDVKSYNFSISTQKITKLSICLKNKNKTFYFNDYKDLEQAMKEKSVFSIFFSFVKEFNKGKQPGEQILFEPGFLITKSGDFLLYALIFLAISDLVIHLIISPSTSYFSMIIGFFFVSLVINARLRDLKFYASVRDLEPLTISEFEEVELE